MKSFLFLLAITQTLTAANGLYTHSVTQDGKLVHQLVQEVFGNQVVQDEWYKTPDPGIDAMVVTTRGGLAGTVFYPSNYSALTWFKSGGEITNYWRKAGSPILVRNDGNHKAVSGNYVHSFTWIFGTKPPILKQTRVLGGSYNGRSFYDINVLIKTPPKTQFDIFESDKALTNWVKICTLEKPLGDGTNTLFEKELTNTNSFYKAKTIWPRIHTPPQPGSTFTLVPGPPLILPTPAKFEYVSSPGQPKSSGPPQPSRKGK